MSPAYTTAHVHVYRQPDDQLTAMNTNNLSALALLHLFGLLGLCPLNPPSDAVICRRGWSRDGHRVAFV